MREREMMDGGEKTIEGKLSSSSKRGEEGREFELNLHLLQIDKSSLLTSKCQFSVLRIFPTTGSSFPTSKSVQKPNGTSSTASFDSLPPSAMVLSAQTLADIPLHIAIAYRMRRVSSVTRSGRECSDSCLRRPPTAPLDCPHLRDSDSDAAFLYFGAFSDIFREV